MRNLTAVLSTAVMPAVTMMLPGAAGDTSGAGYGRREGGGRDKGGTPTMRTFKGRPEAKGLVPAVREEGDMGEVVARGVSPASRCARYLRRQEGCLVLGSQPALQHDLHSGACDSSPALR